MPKHFIPPIIEQYIQSLEDEKLNQNVRDNYAIILERINESINSSLTKYNAKFKRANRK